MSEDLALVQQDETEAYEGEMTATAQGAQAGAEHTERLVPVTEAIRYRRRAQTAERQLGEAEARLKQAQAELQQLREDVADLEKRQRIDQLLAESEVIDIEAARLLTEAAIATMDDADVAEVVADLRRHKPYLFAKRSAGVTAAMPAHLESGGVPQVDAAEIGRAHV